MPYEVQFGALAHPLRQRILDQLSARPMSVRELTEAAAVSQPVMSQHLKVLRDAGMITVAPQGTRNIYAVDAAALKALRAYWEQHWAGLLASLAEDEDDPGTD